MKKILYLSFYDSDMPDLGNKYQVEYLNPKSGISELPFYHIKI